MKRVRSESENSDFWPGFDDSEDDGHQVTSTTNCYDAPEAEEGDSELQPPSTWVTEADRQLFAQVREDAVRRTLTPANNPFIAVRSMIQSPTQPTTAEPEEKGEAYWKRRCLEREAELKASKAAAIAAAVAAEPRAPTPLHFTGSEGDASPSASRGRVVEGGCTCTNFACLLVPGAYNNLDYWAWCKSHGFFNPKCVDHGATHLKEDGRKWVCHCPLEDGTYCRKVAPTMNPPVNPMHLFKALDVLANGSSIGKTCKAKIQLNKVHRNTLGPICHNIARACLVESQVNVPKWARIEVDETCIGRRKYWRGKRNRLKPYWFWSATSYAKNKLTEATHWQACTRRTKSQAERFIRGVAIGARTKVATDFAKCYTGLTALGYKHHKRVNHSVGFKSADGVTTNKAENSHKVVKGYVRAVWGGFGKTGEQVETRAATGAALFKAGDTDERIAKLLKIVKVYWGQEPEITLDEKLTEEAPRKKGKVTPVTAPKVDEEEEPEEGGSASATDEDEEPEEEGPEPEEPGLMFGVLRAQNVLPSLGDNKVIYGQAIRTVLKQHQILFVDQGQRDWGGECGHLPRGLAKADKFGVIMCHNDHWFSGVADSNHLKLFVSDSDKYFKKEDRETCVGEWCQWLQKLWNSKKQVVSVNRSSVEQQGAGSNDGGIHAIRNVLRELRCGEAPVYTRAVIKKAMKHKQTQEMEEDAWKAERDAKEAARKKPAPKKGGKRK